jgi:hypothetical protein
LGDDGTCELETPRRSIRVDVNEIRSVHSSPETDGGRESYTIKYRGPAEAAFHPDWCGRV